jgi:cytochrome P450
MTAGSGAALRSFEEIPRTRLTRMLKTLLASGGGRVNMSQSLNAQYREFGPVVRQFGGPFKFVNLFGPDANRLVLLDRDGLFSAQRPWTQIMGKIFPNGLLLRDGSDHKHHRRIIHEAFKRPALREYVEKMNPMIAQGIASWSERPNPLLAFPAFKELTLQLAAAIVIGTELAGEDALVSPAAPSRVSPPHPGTQQMNAAFEAMVAAAMSRVRLRIPGLEFYRGLKGREFMVDFLRERLAAKRAGIGHDMFSRLSRAQTENGDRLADQETIDHLVFVMMAAHDTTTSTLTSVVFELATHTEWQQRIREQSIALNAPSPSFDQLAQLRDLTNAIYEAVRLYPPLPVIPRIATREFEFEGYRIPAGAMCVVAPIHTHRMEQWWSSPDQFDPDRFGPERAEHERHTHSWIPFGGGPHMCIGKRFAESQVRMIIHHLVQRYRWTVPDGYRMPVQEAPISKPRDGLPITLEPIH